LTLDGRRKLSRLRAQDNGGNLAPKASSYGHGTNWELKATDFCYAEKLESDLGI